MANEMICHRCGKENKPENRFCTSCGAPLMGENQNNSAEPQFQNQAQGAVPQNRYITPEQMLFIMEEEKKRRRIRNYAITSIVMGILGLIFLIPNIFSVLGIIFGVVALIKTSKFERRTAAIVGTVISVIALCVNIAVYSLTDMLMEYIGGYDDFYSEEGDFFYNKEGGGKKLTFRSGGELYRVIETE